MEKQKTTKHLFGLLGKNISYSFSSGYFNEKFAKLGLSHHEYQNFDLQSIHEFPALFVDFQSTIKGFNVTIPFKESIFDYLNKIDKTAQEVGAVNTIKITKKGNLKGYNTDVYGFEKSLVPLLKAEHQKALILGTGGAAKAIAYVLSKLNIPFLYVSRTPSSNKHISYQDIDEQVLKSHQLIVNCSPIGTFPETKQCPAIPYQFLGNNHLLYDLIYNPAMTTFLENGKQMGASTKNGFEMLQLQAEKSWEIWNT